MQKPSRSSFHHARTSVKTVVAFNPMINRNRNCAPTFLQNVNVSHLFTSLFFCCCLEDFWVENESEDIVGLDLTASHQAPSVTGGWSSNMAQP